MLNNERNTSLSEQKDQVTLKGRTSLRPAGQQPTLTNDHVEEAMCPGGLVTRKGWLKVATEAMQQHSGCPGPRTHPAGLRAVPQCHQTCESHS